MSERSLSVASVARLYPLYTIGHSTHPIEQFIGLLRRHGVSAVADVRSTPYSRRNPQFDRERLHAYLGAAGSAPAIRYVFLGDALGGRGPDPGYYERGVVQYDRLARRPEFAVAIARLIVGLAKGSIALVCAEGDPLTCHRSLLVARRLRDDVTDIRHILQDGRIETQRDLELRLLSTAGLQQRDLFDGTVEDPADALAAAYERQAARCGHRISGAVSADDATPHYEMQS